MNARLAVVAALSIVLPLAAHAEEATIKQDVKDAAHSIKRAWKKGWHATKKTAKEITHEAADAAEKAAKKTKENLDN